MEKEERVKDETLQFPTISSPTAMVLKGLFMVMDFLYRGECRSEVTKDSITTQTTHKHQDVR